RSAYSWLPLGWRTWSPDRTRTAGLASRPKDRAATQALRHLQDLDPVAVGIFDEREAVASLADRVGGALPVDPLLGKACERRVDVVGGDRDVAVAGADLVGVHAEVVGELQARRVTVARLIHEHVDRLVADWDAARLLEAQGLVEGDRAVDVGDSI